jgi:DNA-binding ferritin-like protein
MAYSKKTKKDIINKNNIVNKKSNTIINKKKLKKEELVILLLKLLIIIKVYHWKTYSYSEHKATDELYENLNNHIDKFVEILLGKNGSRLNMKGYKIDISDPIDKEGIKKIIYEYRILLENDIDNYISAKNNTDLYTIRDEILGELNQFLYLITFK